MRGRGAGSGSARRARLTAALASLALLATGCGAEDILGPPPGEPRAGLYLTGTIGGRQVAVSDGAPRLFEGNCQPAAGEGADVCFISRELGGRLFVLLLRNPAALAAGETLAVEDPGCTHCDDVTGVAVVDVRLDEDPLRRASGGELVVQTAEPGVRYSGRVRLTLPDGRVSGEFDVVWRPD